MNMICPSIIAVLLISFVAPTECWLFDLLEHGWGSLGFEVCTDSYVNPDSKKLEDLLDKNVFGQHLVREKLPALFLNHYSHQPRKALVIVMHGWTGCGKNYVAKMVAESIFRRGLSSRFVHLFSGRLHFPLTDRESVEEYKVNLQTWIRGNVSNCPRSLFIFDEVDKISPGIVDAITPFFDYHESISSVDYRQAVFLFLSNIGGDVITKTYVEMWENGIPREKMEYKYFESALRKHVYHTSGVFEKSNAIEQHLVSLYLPFLPLERSHVSSCVVQEMKRQVVRHSGRDVEKVLDEMEYYLDRFSVSGCKRVSDMVAMMKYDRIGDL